MSRTDRHARVGALAHRRDDLVQRRGAVDGLDVGARHHHVPDLKLAEGQRVQQDGAFFFAEGGLALLIVRLVFLDQLFERLAQRMAVAIALLHERAKPRQQGGYELGALVGVRHVGHDRTLIGSASTAPRTGPPPLAA